MAGVAILGTLLAGVLTAAGRFRAQDARSALRLQACRIADEILARLWARPEGFPRSGGGSVPNHDGWRWRSRLIPNTQARKLHADVVAVELLAPGHEGIPGEAPSACVEIVLPAPPTKDDKDDKTDRPDAD